MFNIILEPVQSLLSGVALGYESKEAFWGADLMHLYLVSMRRKETTLFLEWQCIDLHGRNGITNKDGIVTDRSVVHPSPIAPPIVACGQRAA
jgi:hypothetical protein